MRTILIVVGVIILIIIVYAITNKASAATTITKNAVPSIQNAINAFMSDTISLNNLDHIKIGGAHGVKANQKTAEQFIFNWAITSPNSPSLGTLPGVSTYLDYNYPGIMNHIDNSAGDGLDRGGITGSGSSSPSWFNIVAGFIPYLGPVLQKIIK